MDLDWKLGVALAGASFEAYGLLAQPGLPKHHACGADTHYMDRWAADGIRTHAFNVGRLHCGPEALTGCYPLQ